MNTETQHCIDDCLNCQATCEATLSYWLARDESQRDRSAMLVLLDCADICRVTAAFLLRRSPRYPEMCRFCAEICAACAGWCERFPRDTVMMECAAACRACGKTCEAP
ncbi:MAG: four-helix bundle copper-binding protein [Gemmatimonadales bacterium]